VSAAPRPRILGIDVARGIASVLMIQGHALDAWASPEVKRSALFVIESAFLQTLALPAFLVLAGASLALRIEAATLRGESAAAVRGAVIRRGAQIVAVGYGLSAFSALVDGWESLDTFFRADVLHVIGLSLIVLAAIGIRARRDGSAGVRGTRLALATIALIVVPIAATPWISRAGSAIPVGIPSWIAGLVIDVPEITRMPLVPLIAWAALGLHVARETIAWNRGVGAIAGAPEWLVVRTFVRALGMTIVFTGITWVMVALGDRPLSRAHVAVIPNAIELAGRGAMVMAAGMWVTPRLGVDARDALARFGRGSLWAYVFHIPICYGALGEPLRARLGALEVTAAALALVVVSWLVVRARDAIALPRR
jgi:acyltransferase